ncbi:hypothetical protein ACIPEN_14390 [Herbaspirillum chlorophenolicum]|uniref:Phage protein n=1 Tax=Herbaspirillum chlorophenolicum TaxID=211589 RepID=A0ABW8F168_9BURK
MMFTATETHIAAKRHRCSWCWQNIAAGETYKRYRSFYDGAMTVKMHPECHRAMQAQAAEEGGTTEWVPGMERPEKEVA